jgi:hypothetical protein
VITAAENIRQISGNRSIQADMVGGGIKLGEHMERREWIAMHNPETPRSFLYPPHRQNSMPVQTQHQNQTLATLQLVLHRSSRGKHRLAQQFHCQGISAGTFIQKHNQMCNIDLNIDNETQDCKIDSVWGWGTSERGRVNEGY